MPPAPQSELIAGSTTLVKSRHLITTHPSSKQASKMSDPSANTLTILGCGTLGTAILCGIQDALSSSSDASSIPASIPSRFIACVQRASSGARIEAVLAVGASCAPTQILVNDNLAGIRASSAVLLGCKPYMVGAILSAPGVAEALSGKLLVSICAGVTIGQLHELAPKARGVVRVMPNTAAKVRESMTVIAPQMGLPEEDLEMVQWVFSQIGRCLVLEEKHMDVATALCGSGPAFYALFVEAMADGGVLMGVPRQAAVEMAAQSGFPPTPSGMCAWRC